MMGGLGAGNSNPPAGSQSVTENVQPTSTAQGNDAETIRLSYTSDGLSQKNINVKKGKSYKLLIDVQYTVSGCMSRIVIPGLDGNMQNLTAGNVVEFNIRPTQSGQFPLTCPMGIPHGYINVE